MPSEKIQEAINEIRAAEGDSVTLNLNTAFREEDDAKCIAEGIKEARVPLTLDLERNAIGEAGAKFISEGIKAARVPLTLNLENNGIGKAGAQFVAEGIKAVRVPLTLNLENNDIGKAGAQFVAEGIKEARVPLTLDLGYNEIGNAGAKFLSEGIKEARVPLTLNLMSNSIGDAGTKFLAEGIKEARFPLTLDLGGNKIGEAGAKFLSEAIKEARVPLRVHVESVLEGVEMAYQDLVGVKIINDAQKYSFIIDAIRNPSEFFAKLRFNPFSLLGLRLILIQTPIVKELIGLNYPKDIAIVIQDYDPDYSYLAWKVVAAIRAVEGASRENKYYSINYELLTAVYSTPPGVDVASVLEGAAMVDDNQEERREAPIVISVEVAQGLNAEGIAYEKSGDNSKALDYKERALKLYQELYQRDHPEVARSLNAVGVLYEKLGDAKKSITYKEAALKMRRALYEGAQHDIADLLKNVGVAYELLGKVTTDLRYKEQGLEMMQAVYPGNHAAVVASLYNVALGYQKLGDVENSRYYKGRADDVRHAIEQQNQEEEFKGQATLDYTDNSYPEYYNSGLDRALELRLSGLTNTVSLKSRYFVYGLGYEAQALSSYVGTILSQGNQVVAPINLDNKHWVGLLFKGFGDRVEVTYMDPEQATMLPGLRSELENGLSLNGYESRIEEAKLTPQSYNNCGYEVIENFVYHLTGTRATQGGAMYVHSLLVENSLLDPEVYGLKIEENTKLIKFLSNAEPIGINEITLFAEKRAETKHERAVPDNRIAKLKTDLHRASVLFKALDFAVDSARLVQEPSLPAFKKLVLDYAYLQAMVAGVNSYSAMIAGAETLYQLQLGEYQKAFSIASTTMGAMALPVILAMANRPYLWLVYGAWMTAVNAYGSVTNAYSFVLEVSDEDAVMRSAMAYKDLSATLASSPLQALYDFEAKVKEYKLQINDLLFEKEKSVIQAEVKDEFGQKVFDSIHLPSLVEKYGLMSDVIRGILTEEEAQALQSNHVTITSQQQNYEHCMELRSEGSKSSSEYYCYNLLDQVLDHVELTAQGGIVIIEHL